MFWFAICCILIWILSFDFLVSYVGSVRNTVRYLEGHFFSSLFLSLINPVQSIYRKETPAEYRITNLTSEINLQKQPFQLLHVLDIRLWRSRSCSPDSTLHRQNYWEPCVHVLSYKKVAADVRTYFSEGPFQNTVWILSRYIKNRAVCLTCKIHCKLVLIGE